MKTIIAPQGRANDMRERRWSVVESGVTLAHGSVTGTLAQARAAANAARMKVPSISALAKGKRPARPLRRNLRRAWGNWVYAPAQARDLAEVTL